MAWVYALAIFVFIGLSACGSVRHNEAPTEISVEYSDDKAVSVSIPFSSFPEMPIDADQISLFLENGEANQAVLGNTMLQYGVVRFTPAIPLRRSLSYEVRYKGMQIDQFSIPESTMTSIPELVTVYPTSDTVPENLLKIHLAFSEQMSEHHSSNYVSLLNDQGDTLNHIFLRLDPELWNYDHTVLTLWLEPGRIKKSLLPNVLDGIPIEQGNEYTIAVSDKWKSAKGVQLKEPVFKTFFVEKRDESMPVVSEWKLKLPPSSTVEPLEIRFYEALDYTSLLGSFTIKGDKEEIEGTYSILNGETGVEFIPNNEWAPGSYVIEIDGSIEDLAANNLNRLFDRDLLKDSTDIVESDKRLMFEIQDIPQ